MSEKKEIVYFELNNWFQGVNYPAEEPFISWLSDDFHIVFNDEEWVEENKLVVSEMLVDMSQNFCVSAPKSWVEEHCPNLLEERNSKFVYKALQNGRAPAFGRFGCFYDYEEPYIGKILWHDEDGNLLEDDE